MKSLINLKKQLNPDLKYIEYNLSHFEEIKNQIIEERLLLSSYSENDLKERARDIRTKIRSGTEVDELIVDTYAMVYEVIRRLMKITPFDTQLLTALALQAGRVVEMQTGEGKTLAAVFPTVLNAFSSKGVHILTFNDYLARRDAAWMGPVYEFFGLTVGAIQDGMPAEERKKVYQRDIIYGTAKQVGFDYLKSQLAFDKSEILLRPLHFAIVDEADAVLIDESRNPLILAGNRWGESIDLMEISHFVNHLEKDVDYTINSAGWDVYLNDSGTKKVDDQWSIEPNDTANYYHLYNSIQQALIARHIVRKDVDYITKNGQVALVDEFTGRILKDRRWKNGLQAAVEIKEKVEVKDEGVILNTITVQHFIQKYPKFSGMTATAVPSAYEFFAFYKLNVTVIPPNKTDQREDLPDLLFKTKTEKTRAIIEKVRSLHQNGQPILIGTVSVAESEDLAKRFIDEGMFKVQVLNANNDEEEAAIIAEAGKPGAITISTNMAGRGTDILLGGSDESDKQDVLDAGGLFVLGTNKHESSRIDGQLKGRAGRQGDPGVTQFFISLEDDLFDKYELSDILPKKLKKAIKKDGPIPKNAGFWIGLFQNMIEDRMFERRKFLYEFASFIEYLRQLIQNERAEILLDDDQLLSWCESIIDKPSVPPRLKKLRPFLLSMLDRHWSSLAEELMELREDIRVVALGGQNPLREFRKRAETMYLEKQKEIELDARTLIHKYTNGELDTIRQQPQRPELTWTYILQEPMLDNALSMMLMGSGNIGMQVDFISVFFLAIKGIYDKLKKKKSKTSN